MLDSRIRHARKAIRNYLNASAQSSGERVATYGGHTITSHDLRVLLDAERAARRHAKTQRAVIRTQAGQVRALQAELVTAQRQIQHLQTLARDRDPEAQGAPARVRAFLTGHRKVYPLERYSRELLRTAGVPLRAADLEEVLDENAALRRQVQTLKAEMPGTPEGWAAQRKELREARAENAALRNNVSELAKQIKDPPGSTERWHELRFRAEKAEAQIRVQAEQLRDLPTPEMWRDTQAENKSLRASIRTLRDTLAAQTRAPGTVDYHALWEKEIKARDNEVLNSESKDRRIAYLTEVQRKSNAEQARLRAELEEANDAGQKLQDRNRTQAGTIEQQDAKVRVLTAERDRLREIADNQREEKVKAQRAWREMREELDRARAGKPPLHPEPDFPRMTKELQKLAESILTAFRDGR